MNVETLKREIELDVKAMRELVSELEKFGDKWADSIAENNAQIAYAERILEKIHQQELAA